MTREATVLPTRRVQFNLDSTPLHWLPGDNFSSHMINGIHLLLPAGELWFCRVYNKALPLVTDPVLLEEMQGFIRQEALLRNCPSEHSYPFPQTIQDTRIVCGVPSRVN